MICWLSCEGAVVAGGVGSGGEERGERREEPPLGFR